MELLNKIFEAGVVGAGGAGFPTHKKLDCKVKYFIVNGCECEPLLKTDQYLMKYKAKEILEAISAVGKVVDAKKCIIGIKAKYVDQIKVLEEQISKGDYNIQISKIDNFYPAGDEQILVQEVFGKSVPPLGIPFNVGAVVDNVETMYNIYEAINGRAVTHRYVSIIGEVNEPRIIRAPIGISVKALIEAAGGTTIENYSIILGGPMMGKYHYSHETYKLVITKTTGAILVVPEDSYVVKKTRINIDNIIKRAQSLCIQCRTCTEMCPRYLNGHQLEPHKIMRAVAFGKIDKYISNALICSECGICEMYACPMGLAPREVNIYLKELLKKNNIKYIPEKKEFVARESRKYKKVPTTRLVYRLGLNKYSNQQLKNFIDIEAKEVRIPLKQHIGTPAVSIVNVGDWVECGQKIGIMDKGVLGSNVHASIKGRVTKINDYITICYTEKEKLHDFVGYYNEQEERKNV